MMVHMASRTALCILILFFGLVPVRSPAGTQLPEMVRFEGYLQDSSGHDIDGAVVTLRVVKSGHELGHVQSKNGVFRLWYTVGEPGPYELRFEASGFESQTMAWTGSNWPYVVLQVSKAH